MSKTPGTCIFCGGGGLSKEHVWASWLHELIGKAQNLHFLRRDRIRSPGVVEMVEDRQYQGSLTNRKRRCVCTTCNNGWMSGIEDRAKAAMAPAILGQPTTLSINDQISIGTWLTLKTIIEDRSHIKQCCVPDYEVAAFHRLPQPLPSWRLFIGSYQGRFWNPSRLFYAWGYAEFEHGQQRYQATTWVAGSLYLHAMSGTGPLHQIFGFPYSLEGLLHQIHPVATPAALALPRQHIITDLVALETADALYQWLTGHRSANPY